jgi:hypothetical protein
MGSLRNARAHGRSSESWAGIHPVLREESPESHGLFERFWDNCTTACDGTASKTCLRTNDSQSCRLARCHRRWSVGYYVSITSTRDASKEEWNPHRYLDASVIAYSVIRALQGVSGLVIRNAIGGSIPYVCGDSPGSTSSSTTLGECSGAVYLALGCENEGDSAFSSLLNRQVDVRCPTTGRRRMG